MKVIGLQEIRSAIQMPIAIDAIREGFITYAEGQVQLGAVGHLAFDQAGGDCHIKSAAPDHGPYFVVKVASGFPNNLTRGLPANSGLMMLFDATSGCPVCLLLDEGWLTDLRTAVAGLLAAQLIKRPGATRLGIVGTGTQARLQAQFAVEFGGFAEIMVWGRNSERAMALATELRDNTLRRQATNVTATPHLEEVARFADVIITTTPSRSPLLDESMFSQAPRIVAVGADVPGKQELSQGLTSSMDAIIADSVEQCTEHGELAAAYRSGLLIDKSIIPLGKALRKGAQFEANHSVLVDLTGLGVQDLQIASLVWNTLSAGNTRDKKKPARQPWRLINTW
jgi:ornithine cyclodeaminase